MVKAARHSALALGLCCVGLLSGCGFQPLYAGPGFSALPGLTIEAEDGRIGYLVEDALRDTLGSGRSPYHAVLETDFRESAIGLSATGRARRFSGEIRVDYTLTGPDGFEHSGRVSEPVFYDAPSDPYSLIAARSAAEERAADRVAEQLAQEFATVLQRAALGLEP